MAELDPHWPDWRDFLTAALQDCEAQLQQVAAGRSLCRLDVPARELAALKQLEGRYTSYRTLARETLAGEPLSWAELEAAVARQVAAWPEEEAGEIPGDRAALAWQAYRQGGRSAAQAAAAWLQRDLSN